MPPGNLLGSACRRPLASRCLAGQQSSIQTYSYPASLQPSFTITSAICMYSRSLPAQEAQAVKVVKMVLSFSGHGPKTAVEVIIFIYCRPVIIVQAGQPQEPVANMICLDLGFYTGGNCFEMLLSDSYLMQLLGSVSQSTLHMNLSQCSQPIVGVSASPLSNELTSC